MTNRDVLLFPKRIVIKTLNLKRDRFFLHCDDRNGQRPQKTFVISSRPKPGAADDDMWPTGTSAVNMGGTWGTQETPPLLRMPLLKRWKGTLNKVFRDPPPNCKRKVTTVRKHSTRRHGDVSLTTETAVNRHQWWWSVSQCVWRARRPLALCLAVKQTPPCRTFSCYQHTTETVSVGQAPSCQTGYRLRLQVDITKHTFTVGSERLHCSSISFLKPDYISRLLWHTSSDLISLGDQNSKSEKIQGNNYMYSIILFYKAR